MNISFDISDIALRCSLCNKPLSIPPILHNAELGNICGRCEERALNFEQVDNTTLQRQRVYENIAKYLVFPCSYQVLGCNSELGWNSVHDHEEICEFKNIVCPLSNEKFLKQCNWMDDHSKLTSHIRKDHKKFFAYPPEVVLKQDLKNEILFSEIAGYVFIIILDYNTELNKYLCCISTDLNWKDCQNYQYQVEIFANPWDNPIVLRKNGLQTFHGNTSARLENSLEINTGSFKHLFERANEITLKISISKKSYQDQDINNSLPANLSLNRTEISVINEDLLHDLECPVCVEFMHPPIFICQAGHNVCSTCNAKLNLCPICRGPMLGGRNFTLEKLTATINYPCAYRDQGCGFAGPLAEVKKHQDNCILTERACFKADCPWKGPGIGLTGHILDSHDILALNTVFNLELTNSISNFFIYFDNKIFILNVKFNLNKPLEYNVQCVGGGEVEYKHELQIIGSTIIDIKITLCHLCQPVGYKNSTAEDNNFKVISIPFTFLSQFLSNFHQMSFKLNIKRLNE